MATQTLQYVVSFPQSVPSKQISVRAANNRTPGVRTFYVASESKPGVSYVVQFIRRSGQRRWFCDCADFKFRRLAEVRHCKHVHVVVAMARVAHGVSRLALSLQPTIS